MNAYISNREKNRPKFPEDREKFGTEFMDDLEESPVGKFFDLSGERQRIIDQASREGKLGKVSQFTQKIKDKTGEVVAPVLKPVGAALGKISDVTQIDERISTPLTFVAAGAAAKGISKIKPKHLGITQTIEPYTPPKSVGKVPRKMVNITDQVDEVFNMPSFKVQDIVRVAKKNKISYKQAEEYLNLKLKGFEPKGTLKPGSTRFKKGGLFDPDRDDINKFLFMTQGNINIPMIRSSKAISNIQQGKGSYSQLNDSQKLQAIEIVKNLEQFHIAGLEGKIEGWKVGRPTTKYSGERIIPYTRKDGTKGRMYFNWSEKQQTYKATDIDKLTETRIRRKNWNTNSPGLKGQSNAIYATAVQRNAAIKESIKQLETTNPQLYREILGGNQTWYVEHIHAQKSPFWNKPRPFKPRDPVNIVAIGDDIFPKMKTAIEAILYSDKSPYKDKIYLDYDRKTQDLILRDAETDLQIGSAIPGMTNTRDARAAFLRALEGGDPLTLAEINPDLRKFIDYQDKISESIAKQKPDVDKSGARPKETDRFDEYRLERERILVQIEAHNSGLKVLNTQYLQRLKKRLFALNKIIDQGRMFDTKPGQGFLKNLLNDIFPDD